MLIRAWDLYRLFINIDELSASELLPLWVKYADELPTVEANSFFKRSPNNIMEMLQLFYGTKYKAWEYEAEFRLISMEGDVLLGVPGEIVEVILGEKVSSETAAKVYESVRGTGVKVAKMMRDPGTWKYRAYGS